MMTCKEMAELLQDFLDSELPKEYMDTICHHLRECGPCVLFLEQYKMTARICRDLPCMEMPAEMRERLQMAMKEIEQSQQQQHAD